MGVVLPRVVATDISW